MTTTPAEAPRHQSAPETAPAVPSGDAASNKNSNAASELRSALPKASQTPASTPDSGDSPTETPPSDKTYEQDASEIDQILRKDTKDVKDRSNQERGRWHNNKLAIGGGKAWAELSTDQQIQVTEMTKEFSHPGEILEKAMERGILTPSQVAEKLQDPETPWVGKKPDLIRDIVSKNPDLLQNPEFIGSLSPEQGEQIQSFEAAQKAQQEALAKNTESIQSTLSEIDPSGGNTYLSGDTAKIRPSDEQIQSMAQALGSETLSSDQTKMLDEHPELLRKLAGTEIAGGQLTISEAGKLEAKVPEIKDGNLNAAGEALQKMPPDIRARIPDGAVAGKHEYGEYTVSADKIGFQKSYDGKLLNADLASGNPKAFDALGDPEAKELATPESIKNGWSKLYQTDKSKAFDLMDEGGYLSPEQMMNFREKNNEHFIREDGCYIDPNGTRKTVTPQQQAFAKDLPPDKVKQYIETIDTPPSAVQWSDKVKTTNPAETSKNGGSILTGKSSNSNTTVPKTTSSPSEASSGRGNSKINTQKSSGPDDNHRLFDTLDGTLKGRSQNIKELNQRLPDGSRVAVNLQNNSISIGTGMTYGEADPTDQGNSIYRSHIDISLNGDGTVKKIVENSNFSEIVGDERNELIEKLKEIGINL